MSFDRSFKRLGSAALIAVAIAWGVPQPAAAQGLLGEIFGALGIGRQPQRSTPDNPGDDRYPQNPGGYPDAEPRQTAGSGVSCVRLCDGRHFPVPRSVSGRALDSAQVCAALCPQAETKVFNGSNMQYASANDGSRYSDLPNAFVYRDRNVDNCTCTGKGPGGLAQIDVESDPTLRAGDVVMLATGPTQFRGSNQFPYRTADFTPIGDINKANQALKQKLSEIQVDPSAVPATPASRLDPSAAQPQQAAPPPQQRPRPQAPQPQPQRSGFPFFPFFN
ncbi:hypothetical protein GJW-30_1_01806 [Variibacter gotjawalensis]|uniref:DUF2865 domain-containing protein n=1 Tax=Variibacter gotjawalensis TaxID=1333996 RepID=A0A0S3PTM9_9BRAD|nr:DUF2865 domain-containing protein [Variibacter gotjawalensis]NIK49591.1 hypothetical protein [Variibacter gotjawalensis]RZS45602.1 uncharacterized protein DUF2865 [Variibacter gotjawalensis]BAT59275.1 hypothetical protein GJW-30_1_01806 [Variibacter gotjawalensis]